MTFPLLRDETASAFRTRDRFRIRQVFGADLCVVAGGFGIENVCELANGKSNAFDVETVFVQCFELEFNECVVPRCVLSDFVVGYDECAALRVR